MPRKPLKEGEILCCALDGRNGGRARTCEAKVGALGVAGPDGEGGMRTVHDECFGRGSEHRSRAKKDGFSE